MVGKCGSCDDFTEQINSASALAALPQLEMQDDYYDSQTAPTRGALGGAASPAVAAPPSFGNGRLLRNDQQSNFM